jgi:hypothetical protein
LADQNHATEVKLSEDDRLRLVMWIDANAPYHDRFVNKRAAAAAYNLPQDPDLQKGLAAIHQRRCAACHAVADVTRLDWIDIRAPQQSLFLTAPLAPASGGTGKCREAVYPGPADADYQAALGLVAAAVERLRANPRRDVQALQE